MIEKKTILMLCGKNIDENPIILRAANTLSKEFYVHILYWARKPKNFISTNPNVKIEKINFPTGYGLLRVCISLWIVYIITILKLLKIKFDALHIHDIHYVGIALLVVKLKNKKIVYDVHDWYNELYLQRSILRKLLVMIDKLAAKFSNCIIVPTPIFSKYYLSISIKKPILILLNLPEKTAFLNIKKKTSEEFVIGYIGQIREVNIYEMLGLLEIIKELPTLKLLVIGGGTKKALFEEKAKYFSNVIIKDFLLYSEIIEHYASIDCIYVVYSPEAQEIKYSVPMKIFEAMAVGIPVITNDTGYVSEFVREKEIGLCVSSRDNESIKTAISALKNSKELREKLGSNGRKLFKENYNWESHAVKLLDFYRDLFFN